MSNIGGFGFGGNPRPSSAVGSGSASLLQSLLAYWKWDGDRVDATGNGHDANIASGTFEYVAGVINDGIKNQVDARLSFAAISLPGSWSVSKWIKLTSSPPSAGHGAVFTQGQFSIKGIFIDQTNHLQFWNGAFIPSTGTVATGVLAHVVLTYDGTTLKFYIDNVAAGSSVTAIGTWTPASIFQYSGSPLNALIDETGIWQKVLSADEIAQLYNGGAGLSYDNF